MKKKNEMTYANHPYFGNRYVMNSFNLKSGHHKHEIYISILKGRYQESKIILDKVWKMRKQIHWMNFKSASQVEVMPWNS